MKKINKTEKKRWIEKLKPYALAYEKAQDQYYALIADTEIIMNDDLKSKVWEYEIHISEYGIMFGRRSKKTGRAQGLVRLEEFDKEAQNE